MLSPLSFGIEKHGKCQSKLLQTYYKLAIGPFDDFEAQPVTRIRNTLIK